MGSLARLSAVLACLMIVPVGLSQGLDQAPPVEIEDVSFEEPLVPAEDVGEAQIAVSVGCDGQETLQTVTTATFTLEAPSWANAALSPRSLSWSEDGQGCPAPTGEMPYEGQVNLTVSPDETAPAFETTQFPVNAEITKQPPAGEARSYGPYTANVTLTPGYKHMHQVTVDEPVREGSHNDTLSFTVSITNEANGATDYTLSAGDTQPATEVGLDPETLTLEPGASGDAAVDVALADATQAPADVTLDLTVEATPSDASLGQPHTESTELQATFEAPPEEASDEQSIPAPGLAGLAAVLGLAVRLGRRR